MALKDLLSYMDDKLADVYHAVVPDKTKAREPVLKGIDRTLEQFGKAEPSKAPNKWWKAANNVVAFSPKVAGEPLLINNKQTNFIPSERFEGFLSDFRKAVDAGEFDEELANHGKGAASVSVAKASRKSGISSEAAKERGIKAAASRKANRERKEREAAGNA